MTATPMLPPLCPLSDCGGDYKKWIEVLYAFFKADFIASEPTYPNRRWALKRHPTIEGKEATFWHITSEGSVEADRIPELRRSERIRWPRPMIDACLSGQVRCWRSKKRSKKGVMCDRIHIAVPDFSYVLVLDDRTTFVLLWTAFYVDYQHRRRELQREYDDYTAASAAWNG